MNKVWVFLAITTFLYLGACASKHAELSSYDQKERQPQSSGSVTVGSGSLRLCTKEALSQAEIETAYRCQSDDNKREVCLQVKKNPDGSRSLLVTNAADIYSHWFENTGSSSACGGSTRRVCVRSMWNVDKESISGTTAALDLSLAATFQSYVNLDFKTMTGQFKSSFQNTSLEDNFSDCKVVK